MKRFRVDSLNWKVCSLNVPPQMFAEKVKQLGRELVPPVVSIDTFRNAAEEVGIQGTPLKSIFVNPTKWMTYLWSPRF